MLFYPFKSAVRLILYSISKQTEKVRKEKDLKMSRIIFKSITGVLLNLNNITKFRNQLTEEEFRRWKDLNDTQIYWSQKDS